MTSARPKICPGTRPDWEDLNKQISWLISEILLHPKWQETSAEERDFLALTEPVNRSHIEAQNLFTFITAGIMNCTFIEDGDIEEAKKHVPLDNIKVIAPTLQTLLTEDFRKEFEEILIMTIAVKNDLGQEEYHSQYHQSNRFTRDIPGLKTDFHQ
ncbi:MAG: hypothetical protein PHU71_04775 [Candidatus Gracilibacteria bacterium]|nr:hypothetical protein [Candidatus Gracilibacteria bacterium]